MLPYSYLVLGVNPVSNEMNVELNTKISITFAKPINIDTLNSNTIRLRKVNGEYVSYSGKYNNIDRVYELTPTEKLAPNTQYQTMVIGGVDGVLSVDGSYLPSTKTYEFVTVQKEGVTALENLVLQQDYFFITAKWDLPIALIDGQQIYFNVRLSTSNNPEAFDLWPKNPLEGKTSSTNITIPYRLEPGRSYYVHVQGVSENKETAWLTGQIYIENLTQPTTPTEPSDNNDSSNENSGSGEVVLNQLSIVDHFPEMGELQKPSEIVVVFNDSIPATLFSDDQPETNPLFYVVQAPYKESLTLIDLRGVYNPKNALKASISVDSENPNVLVLTPKAGSTAFLEGKEYTVVVSKQLNGINTSPLGSTFTYSFTGTPEHLHGDLEQIKETLSSLNIEPSTKFIQSLMRKHSQYACDIWYESSTYDEALHQDGDAPYYIHQYVNTQVLIDALLHGGVTATGGGDETVTLGELSIKKSGGGGGSSTSISDVITQLQSQLKAWQDLVHGHHNRGYATPGNVVKGENVGALPAYITRTTMTTNFDS